MGDELSDLEYGKKWAAMMGVRPFPRYDGAFQWVRDLPTMREHEVPEPLGCLLDPMDEYRIDFKSEDAAFAALGRAVRAVHAAVPPLTPEYR